MLLVMPGTSLLIGAGDKRSGVPTYTWEMSQTSSQVLVH
jgi:hypothetical protein